MEQNSWPVWKGWLCKDRNGMLFQRQGSNSEQLDKESNASSEHLGLSQEEWDPISFLANNALVSSTGGSDGQFF